MQLLQTARTVHLDWTTTMMALDRFAAAELFSLGGPFL